MLTEIPCRRAMATRRGIASCPGQLMTAPRSIKATDPATAEARPSGEKKLPRTWMVAARTRTRAATSSGSGRCGADQKPASGPLVGDAPNIIGRHSKACRWATSLQRMQPGGAVHNDGPHGTGHKRQRIATVDEIDPLPTRLLAARARYSTTGWRKRSDTNCGKNGRKSALPR